MALGARQRCPGVHRRVLRTGRPERPDPSGGLPPRGAWQGSDGAPAAYGQHGEQVAGLAGSCVFTLAGGRSITVEAEGTFDRPYEPFRRGGLNQMRVRADDGRTGTAIYEVTGARHHRFFPDTAVEGMLPS